MIISPVRNTLLFSYILFVTLFATVLARCPCPRQTLAIGKADDLA